MTPLPTDAPPALHFPPPSLAPLAPVTPVQRHASVDVLRGVAVLGILVMNITSFALPPAAYLNPMSEGLAPYQGEFTGLNRIVWWIQYLVFDMKMMTIFSMLFGAGLVLMDERGGSGFAGVYYRRLLVLGSIGLLHAYLIWFGDILFVYALCGLVLYPMRKLRPRTLIAVGVVLLLFGCVIWSLFGVLMTHMRSEAAGAEAVLLGGGELDGGKRVWLDSWHGVLAGFDPSYAQATEQVNTMRGPYSSVLAANSAEALQMHLFLIPMFFLWRTIAVMLLGMALMKLGVFSAVRSNRFYTTLAAVGYGLGLPMLALGGKFLVDTRFDPADWYLYTGQFNALGSVLVALGHIGVVMLVWRAGVLRTATRRLGAVGRMAFTNYLSQSLICTAVFFGWGLGYFGSLDRASLMLVVLGVWTLQLLWSPWWLARFRFGPAEWVWRTLTYGERQPMRIER